MKYPGKNLKFLIKQVLEKLSIFTNKKILWEENFRGWC